MAERPPPSEQELEVLKVLWDEGPSTVRGVDEVLRGRGVQRIYTHGADLVEPAPGQGARRQRGRVGCLWRTSTGRSRPATTLLRDRLQDLADQLCEGATTPLVLTLVEGHKFSDEELARLRAVLFSKG